MSSYVNGSCDRRVAIIARLDQQGGVQSVVLSLLKGLNAEGIIPDVIWDSQPNPDLLAIKEVMTGYLPVRLPVPSHLIFQFPPTIRYVLWTANIFTTQQIARSYDFYYIFYNGFLVQDGTPHVRYLSGPPLLPQLETVSPGLRGYLFRFFRWVYKAGLSKRFPAYEFHSDSIYVINSHFTADLFEEAHGVRLPVVHPPIDLSGRSFSAEDLRNRDTVTFFSRFVDYKRPEMVLELAKRHPQMRFVLMGGVRSESRPFYQSLIRMASAVNLANVAFFDNPSDEKVREELARTLFYVFPAINEHFGMSTVEAIGSGAIPFVHDSGGQREVVIDPRLRFTDEVYFTQFDHLLQLTDDEYNHIRMDLRKHAEGFSEKVFIKKMVHFMDQSTPSHKESELTNELQAASD